MQAPSETNHNAGLRRQIGRAKQHDSCNVTKRLGLSLAMSGGKIENVVQGETATRQAEASEAIRRASGSNK